MITVAINPAYARFQQQLSRGLENYRRRGYQIALKFDYSGLGLSADQLILALEPHYVSVSARSLNKARSLETLANLRQVSTLVNSIGGDCILTQVESAKISTLVKESGINLVEGGYYESNASVFEPQTHQYKQEYQGGRSGNSFIVARR